MFGKNPPDKIIKDTSKMETIIGPDTIVQGTISAKGAMRVDGKLEGGIAEATTVVVGETGEVQGDINAHNAIIGGKVIGNVITQSSIEILPNAQIHGDIKTAALSIAEGATFEGNCTMLHEKQVIEMDMSASGGKRGR